MNASAQPDNFHRAYLCLGSNIQPVENLRKAIHLLDQRTHLVELSTCWESAAVGSQELGSDELVSVSPNFLNIGALVRTPLDAAELKETVLKPIEKELGRVRSVDKYAPRTMDIDISIFDGQVLDAEIWRRVYLALIFTEMVPGLTNPETGEALAETAQRLQIRGRAIARPELVFIKD